jgi:hypothetical protein
MAKFRLIVFTEPAAGREAEFNEWYNTEHLADVVAVPGFGAAQRFKLREVCGGKFPLPYLAIYDIEAADYAAALKEMLSRAGTPAMHLSEALNNDTTAFAVFEECSPRVLPPSRD